MARRLTQRGKERRHQLMDFAAARFAEQGYHPTSVAEIVAGPRRRQGRLLLVLRLARSSCSSRSSQDAQTDLRRTQQQAIGDEDDPVRRIELGHPGVDGAGRASTATVNKLIQFAATEETLRARRCARARTSRSPTS